MKKASRTYNYKLSFSIAIVVLLCSLINAPIIVSPKSFLSAYGQGSSDWEKYRDSYMGIEVSYPQGWYTDADNVNYMHDITIFSGSDSLYEERVLIMMEKLPTGLSLTEFTDSFIQSGERDSEDFKVIQNPTSTSLSGYSAKSLVFSMSFSEGDFHTDLKVKAILTLVNNNGYVLMAFAQETDYSDYLPTFDEIIASFVITNEDPPERPPNFETYKDDIDRFTIDYDTTWEVVNPDDSNNNDGAIITFYSPLHGPLFYGGYFGVRMVGGIASSKSLADYTDEVLDERRNGFYSFRLLDSKEVTLSGRDAYEIEFTWSTNGVIIKQYEAWTLLGSRAYHIFFNCEEKVYGDYESILEHMISSFELEQTDNDVRQQPVNPEDIEFLQYDNSDYGIKMQYPETWIKSKTDELVLVLQSPLEDFEDEFSDNVLVDVNDYSYTVSLDEYTKAAIKNLASGFESFKLEKSENATLSGYPAHSILATVYQEGSKLQVYSIWTVIENREYFIVFTGEYEKYEKYEKLVQKMVDSFEIEESALVTGFYLYEDEGHGIRAQYPAGWQVKESFESGKAPSITFSSEKEFRIFSINISHLAWNMSMGEYAKSLPWEVSKVLDGFQLVDTSETMLSGYPSYKVIFTGVREVPDRVPQETQPVSFSLYKTAAAASDSDKTILVKGAITFTIKNNIVYSVMYMTFATEYLDFVNTANRMVDSIDIDPSVISEEIKGVKINDLASGLELNIPSGWIAYRSSFDNSTTITIIPTELNGEEDKVSVVLTIRNLDDVIEDEKEEKKKSSRTESSCDPVRESHLTQVSDGVKMFRYEQDCKIYGQDAKTRDYSTFTMDKYLSLGLIANNERAYDGAIGTFDSLVESIVLNGALDISSDKYDDRFGVKSSNQTVVALNVTRNIHMSTDSNVTDFVFDEPTKSLSFKVHGDAGTSGSTTLMLDKVLEPPYIVKIDGVETSDYVRIYDETTGESGIDIYYTHSTHNIVITGTTVVPEFPFPLIAVLGLTIGLLVVVERVKKAGTTSWL